VAYKFFKLCSHKPVEPEPVPEPSPDVESALLNLEVQERRQSHLQLVIKTPTITTNATVTLDFQNVLLQTFQSGGPPRVHKTNKPDQNKIKSTNLSN